MKEDNMPKNLEEWTKNFINSQEPLEKEFQKVLHDNFWDLVE